MSNKQKMNPNTKRILWLIIAIVVYFAIANLPVTDVSSFDASIPDAAALNQTYPDGDSNSYVIGSKTYEWNGSEWQASNILTRSGIKSIAIMIVAVIAWIFEIVPIAIASIACLFLQHIIGTSAMGPAVANFATPTVLFVLSSFFIATAMNVSGFSKRLSLTLTSLAKGSPKMALFWMIIACGALSTVISDVPACAAFYPIALALIEKNNCKFGESNFAKSLLIGIPMAALIGGVGTPAGSSLNVQAIGLLSDVSNGALNISFGQWSIMGLPFVIVTLPLFWWIMTMVFKPEIKTLIGTEDVKKDVKELGPVRGQELKFILIFLLLLAVWFTGDIHHIPIPITTTLGAALFFFPGINILNWANSKDRIGWDIVLLIGAANSLGMALSSTGAAAWIADVCLGGIANMSLLPILMIVILFTIVIHLLVPVNPAIVSILVPTLYAFSMSAGINASALIIPMAFTVSAAFLLPLDPVPLITFGSGQYSMGDYFKAGLPTSILWLILMTVATMTLGSLAGLL